MYRCVLVGPAVLAALWFSACQRDSRPGENADQYSAAGAAAVGMGGWGGNTVPGGGAGATPAQGGSPGGPAAGAGGGAGATPAQGGSPGGPAAGAGGGAGGSTGAGGTAGAAGGTGGSGGTDGAAGGTGGSGGTAGAAGGTGGGATPFGNVSVEDLGNNGTFAGTSTASVGPNNNYTVYHPQELGLNGVKHPVVAWTSGGSTSHIMYPVLPHLATHGFVVISANTVPSIGAQVALGQEMVAGIDWILEENGRSGSAFFDKIDSTKIAAMGYSMGGLATTTIVGDARLTTTVHVSGGTGSNGGIESYDQMHAPAAFLCGTTDMAGPNCDLDFEYITTQSVFYGKFNGDHLCSLLPPCQDWLTVAETGWLRWQLMNDQPLKDMFVGANCTMCNDPNWTVQQKNLI
jgi:hypothetical protein